MTEIVETAVTGLPGRTPREEIERPRTDRELEPMLLLDGSGSNLEAAGEDDDTTKVELVAGVLPLIVGQLEKDDAQGAHEESGGGLRTFLFSEPGAIYFDKGEDTSDDERDLEDVNSANVVTATQRFEQMVNRRGRTHIMPAIRAAEHTFQAEFGDEKSPNYKPMRSRPAIEMLVITDGKLDDADEFEAWLSHADETCVVAVAVIGFGAGHDHAVAHYKALAEKNQYLTYVALTGVSDPMEVAFDLRMLAGLAS